MAEAWRAQREPLIAQGDALVRQLAETLPAPHDGDPGDMLASAAEQAGPRLRDAAMQSFDAVNGGFGGEASMFDALLRHAQATGDAAARDAVLLTLRRMPEALRVPLGFATLVAALAECHSLPALVVLTGPGAATSAWRAGLAGRYLPGSMVLQLPEHATGLPQVLAKPVGAGPQAWVCRGPQCLPPLADIESLLACLSRDEADA